MPLSTKVELYNGLLPVSVPMTALIGGGQPGAPLALPRYAIFNTVTSANDSAQLPMSAPNTCIKVCNTAAANSMRLFVNQGEPASTLFSVTHSSIFTGGANFIDIPAGDIADLVSYAAGHWLAVN